jgi:hypothetical protein
MYVPFFVFCLVVLFCVLFGSKCVLDYCHRDIEALLDYPNREFSVLFPQLYGKCQGITRKDGARPALPIFCFLLRLCMFRSLYSVYCLRANVYCTAATRCQPVYCLCVNVYCLCVNLYCLCVNAYCTAVLCVCKCVLYCLCVNVYCVCKRVLSCCTDCV